MAEDRYNIENYTDNELYDLLDLTNPSDRVLEAKIISMINKYSTNATEEGLKITKFFYEIYNHFFETTKEEREYEYFGGENDDEDEYENYEETPGKIREGLSENNNYQMPESQTQASTYSQVAQLTTPARIPDASSILQSVSGDQGIQSSINVKQQDYKADKLNPLLKQTIKRIISIDSQFRNIQPDIKQTTTPTNFTFNLSQPLKDVVSLSLYSVQIPYTWYTINKNYGGNFFYLKGNSAGINIDPVFNYKIDISAGNYQPAELVDAINVSIADISNANPDVKFGKTNVKYNRFTNNASITVDIQNYFNESNYQLQFNNWSYPLILNEPLKANIIPPDNNQQRYLQSTNIGAYLGFNSPTYRINTIYSINNGTYTTRFNDLGLTTNDPVGISDFVVDSSNNYFTIIHYYNENPMTDFSYTSNPYITTIDISFQINLSTGTYGRQAIVDDINYQLLSSPYLIDSSLTRIDIIDNSNNQNFTKSYYQLTINLNKKTTPYSKNSKTVVVFPDENTRTGKKLWVYDPSYNFSECCFNFPSINNELSDITAESYSLQSSYLVKYTDLSSAYMEFVTNTPGYKYDISVNVLKSSISLLGIGLNNLITNITNNLRNHTTTKGNIFTQNTELTNANLNSQLVFKIDLNIPFDNTYFLIDFPENSNNFFNNFNENGVKANIGLSNLLSGNATITTNGNTSINGNAIFEGNLTINGNLSINGNVSISGNTITLIDTGNVFVNGNKITGNTNVSTISNAVNVTINGNLQINTNTSTNINGNINVLGNNIITGNTIIAVNNITTGNTTTTNTGISKTFTFTQNALPTYQIQGNTLFNIHPMRNNGIIDEETTNWNIMSTQELQGTNNINDFVNYVNLALKGFYDISHQHIDVRGNTYANTYSYPLSSSYLSYTYNITDPNNLQIDFTLNIIINKTLTQNDFSMNLIDNNHTPINGNLWTDKLYFESSYNLSKYYVAGTTYSQIINNKAVGAYTCILSKDTTINLKGITNGVYSSGGENDININISAGTYTRTELFKKINDSLTNNPITAGSVISTKPIGGYEFVYFHFNINKIFNASDYRVVFYDVYSFVDCYQGYTKEINSTWDSTLGWILGFREKTEYYLSTPTQTIISDTAVSTNLYNYFLIVLDDYTQSHLNDGLVTITKPEGSIPLPSYTSRSSILCNNNGQKFLSGSIYDNPGNNLTQKQIYAANQILLSQNKVVTENYSAGPFIQDIFGIIPVKVGGIPNGGYYVEFGGTLQNQQRLYFGPVNISRFTIKLIDDRGNLVDLNNANWSFSFICEQLYQQT